MRLFAAQTGCRSRQARPLWRPVANGLILYLGLLFCLVPSLQAAFRLAGVNEPLRQQLLEHLQQLDIPCSAPAAAARRIRKESDAELTRALQALGYFNARFQGTLRFQPKCWQMQYQITPGKMLRIRRADIRISGAAGDESAFAGLATRFSLAPGDPFISANYEKLKQHLQAQVLRQGYFDASFIEHQVDIYPETSVADIRLHWDSGNRYRFGEIQIEQSVLSPDLFRDLLLLETGKPYLLSTLQNDRLHLSESRYFESIEIKPLLAQSQHGSVPVLIRATPGRRDSYEIGAGFSTDTGARLRGNYARHRFNRRGHQGAVNLLLSEVLSNLNLNYVIPWHKPRTDTLQADLSYLNEDNESFESERWETAVSDNRVFNNSWNQSVSLTLTTESAITGDDREHFLHWVPGISWEKLWADNLARPDRGYHLSLALLGSSRQLFSDSSFAQLQAGAKWITPLPWELRLISRASLGFTLVDTIEDLPTSRRFFTGGDNSIRGYEYQSLGPREAGDVVGGKHLAVASLELERPLFKHWSLAGFVDGGNAWNDDFDAVSSTGIGVRWYTPIGPLRVDLAFPLEEREDTFRIHINFGPQL